MMVQSEGVVMEIHSSKPKELSMKIETHIRAGEEDHDIDPDPK